MSPHLSEKLIEVYRAGELSPAELLALDDHLAQCDSCQAEMRKKFAAAYAQAISALRVESTLADSHLPYQQMADYVDGAASDVDRELVDTHLEFCRSCSAEVRDLEAIKASIAEQPAAVYSPRRTFSLRETLAAWWQLPAIRIPIQVAAAIVLVVFAVWLVKLYSRRPEQQAQQHPGALERNQAAPNNSAITPSRDEQKNVRLVADLIDADNHITLTSDDQLAGLESASVQIQNEVALALKNGRVKASPFIADLKGPAGKLMGSGSSDYGLVSPVAVVIESRTPVFRWQTVAGAENYVVTIYDLDAKKIEESVPLTETNWKANAPLERGQVYTWQVRVRKQGGEVLMPPPAAAEAKFRIIDAGKEEELAQVRRGHARSHLVLGLTYANAGMLDESEREFRKLLAANPESAVARSLLRSVEAQKSSR